LAATEALPISVNSGEKPLIYFSLPLGDMSLPLQNSKEQEVPAIRIRLPFVTSHWFAISIGGLGGNGDGPNNGLIGGIVVGVVLLLIITIVVILVLNRSEQKKAEVDLGYHTETEFGEETVEGSNFDNSICGNGTFENPNTIDEILRFAANDFMTDLEEAKMLFDQG
jgi:hypothetical protein